MERIRVNRGNKFLSWFLIIFGIIVIILSVTEIILVKQGRPSQVILLVESLLLIVMGTMGIRNRRYYIEWDENRMNLFLPSSRKVESIAFSEIKAVDIRLFEIEIDTAAGKKIINLDSMRFEELKLLKARFEQLQQSLELR